jgi:hypothetical protein
LLPERSTVSFRTISRTSRHDPGLADAKFDKNQWLGNGRFAILPKSPELCTGIASSRQVVSKSLSASAHRQS